MSQKLFSLSTCCRLALSQQSLAVVFLREAQRSISSTTVATSAVTRSMGALVREPTLPFLFPSGRFQYPVQHVNTRRTSSLTTRSRQRLFSSTSPRTAETVALQNPRTNEEGKELSVTISPRAAKRLREITAPDTEESALKQPSYDHLRVTVTSGGCHGFQYIMSLDPVSKIDPEEDTIFTSEPDSTETEGKNATETGKARIVMDLPSLELLDGSTIDFTTELIGSQFTVVNPRATSSCGCGSSFDV